MNVHLLIFLILIAVLLAFNKNKKKIINIKQKYPNVKLANTFVNKDITQALFDELKDISRNLSNCNNLKLKGKCKEYKYIPATTDENLIMDLDNISKLIISRINSETSNFKFIKTEYDNITERSDEFGNKHYIYDLFALDIINYSKVRFKVDVIQYVLENNNNNNNNSFSIGIPSKNQFIPLPTEVITTSLEVLGTDGINFHRPPTTKKLYINSIKVTNSTLVVNSGSDCYTLKVGGKMNTSLESHSVKSDNTPFIEPSVVRNRWPTLDSQPVNQGSWPTSQIPFTWNQKGITENLPKTDEACTGLTHALNVPGLNAQYWANNIRVPRNSGENAWLFDLSRGITSFPTGSATG
jgi:hypothetical protein